MSYKNGFFIFLLCYVAFISCNKAKFSVSSEPPAVTPTVAKTASPPLSPVVPPAVVPPAVVPPPVETVITKLSPSFVTRAPGCIMCHADIKGGFFLDFGYDPSEQNKFLFGGANDILPLNDKGAVPWSIFYGANQQRRIYLGQSRYFTWFRDPNEPGWMAFTAGLDPAKKSRVHGSIYIPDATFTRAQYPGLFSQYLSSANANLASITLADLIKTPLRVPSALNSGTPVQLGDPMSAIVTPANPGDAPVVVLKELKIGAPTSADIRKLLNGQNCPDAGCLVAIGNHSSVDGFKGINSVVRPVSPSPQNGCTVKEIPTSNAYLNTGYQGASGDTSITCSGDVVVVGSLFLKNLTIKTDAAGCRFYVDGNVWIDGDTITYNDQSSGNAHLQITSTSSIIFGLYNDPTGDPQHPEIAKSGSLLRRIVRDGLGLAWPMMIRANTVSNNRDENYAALKIFLNSILCDGTYAPNNFFTNPPAQPGVKNLKKVILNAPLIQGYFKDSNNLVGDPRLMTGILISETSLFGGNNFSFQFYSDDVFTKNSKFSFLPAFGDDVRNRIFNAVEK